MTRILSTLSLIALIGVTAAQAEARSGRAPARPQASAAMKTRLSAMHDFDARMSRLDALMGVPSASASRAPRSRSAEAGR